MAGPQSARAERSGATTKDAKQQRKERKTPMTRQQMIERILDAELEYPLPKEFNLSKYTDTVAIAKQNLKDKTYYFGLCRNAHIAVWDAKGDTFWYIRIKFGSFFTEEIKHMEDDEGFDVFIPMHEVL